MNNINPDTGNNISKGIALTLISILIFSVQDVAVKYLVTDYPPTQVVMFRFWGVAVFTLVWIMREGPIGKAFHTKRPVMQIARGILLVLDIWCFSAALQFMPLSDLQAIFMLFPVVVTLFAIPILGEKVGIFRWSAIGVGFLGTMIIIRPGFQEVNIGVWFMLGAVTTFALYTVLTRLVARTDSTTTSMAYMAVVGVVLSTSVGIFNMVPMTLNAWLLMLLVIVTANVAHTLFAMAYREAPASALQPFNFLILPAAIIMTVIFFGHWIDMISLFGATLTVGAGLFVWWRERQKAKAAQRDAIKQMPIR
ncbi:DMT family transporter [uncultured Maritalea sp.]|jgi:drug/metabolite transporter (DMT)-like permease|uniref:DMT family transporter n=1 Tax=uncultured Maritalea sp. TaxID=757249 RepID=UPI0026020DA2|nr:DMT family transporter [uncultured Maritalea sp.]